MYKGFIPHANPLSEYREKFNNFPNSDCISSPPPRWIPAGFPSEGSAGCAAEPYDINDGGLLPLFRGQTESAREFVTWPVSRPAPCIPRRSPPVILTAPYSVVKASEARSAYTTLPIEIAPTEKPDWLLKERRPLKPLCRCHLSSCYREDFCSGKVKPRWICLDKTYPVKQHESESNNDPKCRGDGILPKACHPAILMDSYVSNLLYRSTTTKDFTPPSAWGELPCHPPKKECPAEKFSTSVPCQIHKWTEIRKGGFLRGPATENEESVG